MIIQKGMNGIAPDLDEANALVIRQTDQALQLLDRGRRDLLAAKDDLERIAIRDRFQRMRVASEIFARKDIAIVAAELVADAERAIAKANPPGPTGRAAAKLSLPLEQPKPNHPPYPKT